jgi:hypothetical protein
MRSRELIFCLTAAACIAVATNATAETRHLGRSLQLRPGLLAARLAGWLYSRLQLQSVITY